MASSGVDPKELQRFLKYYGRFIEKVPAIKRDAVAAGGKALRDEVRSQIDKQGINDSTGKVKRWQEHTLSSGGGYAKVFPVDANTTRRWRGQTVSAAQLTRWLEKGHVARKPTGKNPRYRPRLNGTVIGAGGAVVKGRLFYSWSKQNGFHLALRAAARELDRITEEWEWD